METLVTITEPTVIWDLDGTLLDSLGVLEDGLAEVLPDYKLRVPAHEVMVANFHGSLEDSINNALGGVELSILTDIVKDFLVVQDTYYDVIADHLHPDAVSLAERLHEAGGRQILVTNRAHEGRLRASPRSIVEHSDLKQYIDDVVCGDDSEHRKPKPAVLQRLIDGGLNLEDAVVIGDQFVDAEFAHNLGASAILVARNGTRIPHLESLADGRDAHIVTVNSLHEVRVS